ncbi:hypothetical protein T458_20025 [Brevibacillus panacihumi W25]|uniref:Uncharacterized protein n=1 Tax=Brevibacillus panacihumi W25 TaxID=1408254 RepID=V6MCR7_9BACL|nr:hypothetical protein [Brevibacillus panacihumi]EST53163.1 hypothetical protein T458_20025 [Brevibacillus panacihumi W25]
MSMFINILASIVLIVMLVYIYKKREENETNLGLKIIGYYLLGSFTFRMNEFPVPLGFLVFLFFFRPIANRTAKHYSAYLGLAFFVLQLIIPAVQEYWYERPRDIAASSANMYQISFLQDWSTIRDQLDIDENARLERFRAEYEKDGEIIRLSYYVVGQSDNEFIRYGIDYSSETQTYTVKRRKVARKWMQYERKVFASRFFEVFDEIQARNLSPEQSFDRIILNSDGEKDKYAIEDRKKLLIMGKEIREITNEELPVEGYIISACSMGTTSENTSGYTSSTSCEDIDYFFDALLNKDEYAEKDV